MLLRIAVLVPLLAACEGANPNQISGQTPVFATVLVADAGQIDGDRAVDETPPAPATVPASASVETPRAQVAQLDIDGVANLVEQIDGPGLHAFKVTAEDAAGHGIAGLVIDVRFEGRDPVCAIDGTRSCALGLLAVQIVTGHHGEGYIVVDAITGPVEGRLLASVAGGARDSQAVAFSPPQP